MLKNSFLISIITVVLISCTKSDKKGSPNLVTATDLKQFGFNLRDTSSIIQEEYLDGTIEHNYTFENNTLFISNTLSICKSKNEAKLKYETYMSEIFNNHLQKENLNNLYKYGDNSMFILLKNDSIPVGNIFLYKKGNEVFFLSLIGVYFNSKEDWISLINHQPSSDK